MTLTAAQNGQAAISYAKKSIFWPLVLTDQNMPRRTVVPWLSSLRGLAAFSKTPILF